MDQSAITTTTDTSLIEEVIAKGDLAKLSPEQRAAYYVSVCKSMGLNPLTQPLGYIYLNGKLTLYAGRGASDQLRKLHQLHILSVEVTYPEDMVSVLVKGQMPDGRTDIEMAVVPLGGLRGDAKANAIMKAITKAKRRLTLSMIGLGWLDETETETIPGATVVSVATDGTIAELPEPATTEASSDADQWKAIAAAFKRDHMEPLHDAFVATATAAGWSIAEMRRQYADLRQRWNSAESDEQRETILDWWRTLATGSFPT